MLTAAALEAVAMERSIEAPVIVPDVQLNFWGEFYRANPLLRARGITFENFLDYQVRNGGALFVKIVCPKPNRRRASAGFRPRPRSEP